jgi:hypothetical protein
LLRRAEIALRIAEKNSNRMQLDSAEAPDMPSPVTMRRAEEEYAARHARKPKVAVQLVDESHSVVEPEPGGAALTYPEQVVPIPLDGNARVLNVLDDDMDDDLDDEFDELDGAIPAATVLAEAGRTLKDAEPDADWEPVRLSAEPETQTLGDEPPVAWPEPRSAPLEQAFSAEEETPAKAVQWTPRLVSPAVTSERHEVPYLRAVHAEEPAAGETPEEEPESLEEMLKRMDQTLDLLRSLKSSAAS